MAIFDLCNGFDCLDDFRQIGEYLMTAITRDFLNSTDSDSAILPSCTKDVDKVITTSNNDKKAVLGDDILINISPTKDLICLMIEISEMQN